MILQNLGVNGTAGMQRHECLTRSVIHGSSVVKPAHDG
jgi:hypothetical protein